jgi:hypothetical protein
MNKPSSLRPKVWPLLATAISEGVVGGISYARRKWPDDLGASLTDEQEEWLTVQIESRVELAISDAFHIDDEE